ncbi:short-chain dehydrogenase [Limnohabitans sp. INBF002]|nr:short-chain dehydrogenase [Limnohabitans sp. INBF002]
MNKTSYLHQTFGLDGRTALVTGSARGIGLSIATALGNAGARVIINDLRSAACDEAVAGLQAQGIEARGASFDVSDHAAVQAAHQQLLAEHWDVDILINNAGNQNRKPLIETTPVEWQQLMNVHVNGSFNCSQIFIPGMRNRGFGRVVMTSSISAEATMPNIAAYSTAKAAMAAMARAIAVEYGPHGVTANAIAPGFVRTEFTVGLQEREGFEHYLQESVPCGRWALPEDIAPVVLFLVSPAARFVNGQTLAIDGGLLARA